MTKTILIFVVNNLSNQKQILIAMFLNLVFLLSYSCKSTIPKTKHTSTPRHEKPVGSAQKSILSKAFSYMGTKYKMGGLDHSGIDCSGLVFVSYKNANIPMPRSAHEQAEVGKRVYIGQLEIGDLVFFTEKAGGTKITHVGIVSYSEPNSSVRFIHASTSKGVREDELLQGYWRPLYLSATRVIP